MTDQNLPEWTVISLNSIKTVRAASPLAALRRVLSVPFPDDMPVSVIEGMHVYPLTEFGGTGNAVVEAAGEKSEDTEEVAAVVIAVHNGAVHNGQLQFAQKNYALPLSVLARIQEEVAQYEIV